jgi:hypothetical protein
MVIKILLKLKGRQEALEKLEINASKLSGRSLWMLNFGPVKSVVEKDSFFT